jgi:predicted nucleic acid-binding protein
MAWCFEDEASAFADGVLSALEEEASEALVPSIWSLEVANVLVTAERKKRSTRAGSTRFLELLHALPVKVDSESGPRVFGQVLELARELELSSYDAAYLELASRHGVPLATADARLKRACLRCGVPMFTPARKTG